MKKSILITSLLMLLCLTVSAQKNKSANKFKEGTSEYYAYEGEKLLKQDKIDEAKAAWKQARMAKQISCDEICLGGDIYLKENNRDGHEAISSCHLFRPQKRESLFPYCKYVEGKANACRCRSS